MTIIITKEHIKQFIAMKLNLFCKTRYPYATRDTISAGWNIHNSYLSYISDDDAKDEMLAQINEEIHKLQKIGRK